MTSRATTDRAARPDKTGRWKERLAYVAVCGLVWMLYLAGGLEFADRKLDEVKFALTKRPATGNVLLVEIDARSIAGLGVWPWPRRLHASALNRLAEMDPQQARVVELKFFSGFSIEEAAEVLSVSISTVKRDWRSAKAWLRHELDKGAMP